MEDVWNIVFSFFLNISWNVSISTFYHFQGKVDGQGIYEDLKNTGTDFKELLSDYLCPNIRDNGTRDLSQEMDVTLKEGVTTLRKNGELSNTIRQKLGLDAYSSEESLESIIMEFKVRDYDIDWHMQVILPVRTTYCMGIEQVPW